MPAKSESGRAWRLLWVTTILSQVFSGNTGRPYGRKLSYLETGRGMWGVKLICCLGLYPSLAAASMNISRYFSSRIWPPGFSRGQPAEIAASRHIRACGQRSRAAIGSSGHQRPAGAQRLCSGLFEHSRIRLPVAVGAAGVLLIGGVAVLSFEDLIAIQRVGRLLGRRLLLIRFLRLLRLGCLRRRAALVRGRFSGLLSLGLDRGLA